MKKIIASSISGLLALLAVGFLSPVHAQAATIYWYNAGTSTQWTTLAGNWYTDALHTMPATALPIKSDAVITVGTVGPKVDLDTWTQPASIDARATGITFTSARNNAAHYDSDHQGLVSGNTNGLTINIMGNATFNGSSVNGATITGNAVFNDTSYNDSSATIHYDGGFDTFTSRKISTPIGIVTGDATFNNSSRNGGVVKGNSVFNDLSYNEPTYYHNYFYDCGSHECVLVLVPFCQVVP